MSDDLPPPPSTPPPPPSGYGAPPPPPYGAAPPGGAPYNAVDAIKYGWAKFTKSPGTILVPGLVFLLSVFVVEGVVQFVVRASLLDTHTCTKTVLGQRIDNGQCGPGFVANLFANALGSFVASILVAALGAGLIKCALNLVDGREVNAGDVFGYITRPNVLGAAALLGVATFVGTLLCILPGIVVQFLTAFTMFFVVDKDQGAVEAIGSSVRFMASRWGDTLLFVILGFVTILVGVIACLVGVFVAAPVVVIAAAYTFRVLNNEPVTPAEA
jgi:uncharacterized membrane protein